MLQSLRYTLVIFMLLVHGVIVSAQESPERYIFDSGVSFTMPPNGTLDLSNPIIPVVTFGDTLLIQMIEPDVLTDASLIDNAPQTTLDMPLLEMMELLLPAVGYPLERSDDFTLQGELGNGRAFAVYEFTNASDFYQTVFVVRMSDGLIGAVNIQSVSQMTPGTQRTILEMIMTFDVAGFDELPQSFTYDSGVTFRFPEAYELSAEDEPVSITAGSEILITMVEPDYAGITAGQSMAEITDYVSDLLDLDASTFEVFDIGEREAVISTTENDELLQSIVIVRFNDDTAGIMIVVSIDQLQGDRLDEVTRIAASFNSDSGDSDRSSTEDNTAQAQEFYEQGEVALDGGDFDTAISLYTDAISLVPNYTRAYFSRAIANRSAGNLEDALADFEKVLDLVPDEAQIHASTAALHALLGDVESAVAEMEIFIEKAGIEALSQSDLESYDAYRRVAGGEYVSQFYISRSGTLRAAGRYERAISDLEIAIENEPDEPLLYARLGLIYLDMGQIETAVDIFTQGIQVEPLRVLYFNRAVAYGELFLTDSDARVSRLNDLECVLLLEDDSTLDENQIAQVERNITTTILDDYEPITDVAQCLP